MDPMRSNLGSSNKSDWVAKVCKKYPEVKDLRERVHPIERSVSFGRIYDQRQDIKAEQLLSHQNVMQLIMQHFQYEGLKNAIEPLERESNVKYVNHNLNESRLLSILSTVLKDVEKIWDLTIGNPMRDLDKLYIDLEEQLELFGMLKEMENEEADDTNIWDEPDEGHIIFMTQTEKNTTAPLTATPSSTSGSQGPLNSSSNSTSTGSTGSTSTSASISSGQTPSSINSSITSPTASFSAGSIPATPTASFSSKSNPTPSTADSSNVSSSGPGTGSSSTGSSTATNPSSPTDEIKAATLNKLVERMATHQSNDFAVAVNFMKTFLMTYKSFTTPEKLLNKLLQRYNVPKHIPEEEKQRIHIRILNVLRKWVEDYYTDFESNEKLTQTLTNFCQTQLSERMSQSILKKLKSRQTEKKEIVFTEPAPDPKVPRNIFSPSLDIHDVDEEEIARQLTLVEFDIYSRIKPWELFDQAWNKKKLKHRAVNVLGHIELFNSVSYWTAYSILNVDKLRSRVRMMTRFIKIAEALRKLNNFNSLMAILAGLGNAAVHRLKFTKEEQPVAVQRVLGDLSKIMSNEQAFRLYRETLVRADPPCIPYLGVYLTDLTFIEDGNPKEIIHPESKKGLINFYRRKLVYNVISLVQQYQQLSYNLQPVYQIAQFFQKDRMPKGTDDDLYRLSLQVEPRGKSKNELL